MKTCITAQLKNTYILFNYYIFILEIYNKERFTWAYFKCVHLLTSTNVILISYIRYLIKILTQYP